MADKIVSALGSFPYDLQHLAEELALGRTFGFFDHVLRHY